MHCAAFGGEFATVDKPHHRHPAGPEQLCGLLGRDRRVGGEDEGISIGFQHVDEVAEGRACRRGQLWRAAQCVVQGGTRMLRGVLRKSSGHDNRLDRETLKAHSAMEPIRTAHTHLPRMKARRYGIDTWWASHRAMSKFGQHWTTVGSQSRRRRSRRKD